MQKDNFEGERKGRLTVKYRDSRHRFPILSTMSCAKKWLNRMKIMMPVEMWTDVSPRKHDISSQYSGSCPADDDDDEDCTEERQG